MALTAATGSLNPNEDFVSSNGRIPRILAAAAAPISALPAKTTSGQRLFPK
jgi:hypothetical protein